MTHAFYVYAAWGISAVVLVFTIGYIWFDSGRLQRELRLLEAQGVRRRSDTSSAGESA